MKEWNAVFIYKAILSIVIIIVLIVLVDLLAYSVQQTGYNWCQGMVEEADAINNYATSNLRVSGVQGRYSRHPSNIVCERPQTIFSDIWSE